MVWQGSIVYWKMPTDSCQVPCTSDTLVRPQHSLARKALSATRGLARGVRHSPVYPEFDLPDLCEEPSPQKKALRVQSHSWSNSRNSGVFSEQLSELHSRPRLCENPILGATLGNGWTLNFLPKVFWSSFFSKLGWPPRGKALNVI